MNRSTLLIFCSVLLILAASNPAQSQSAVDTATVTPAEPATAAVTKDPAGLAVAQRALGAMGGQAQSLQDSLTTGTLTLPGDKPKAFSVVIKTKGTQKVRVELSNADGTRARILNQGQAAIQYPNGKVRKLLMNNTLAERVSHLPIFSLLAERDAAQMIAEYGGSAMVAGRPAAVIALRPVPVPGMSQRDLDATTTKTLFYIDSASGMVTKMEYDLFAENEPDQKDRVEVLFSDYRQVTGVWVPFTQTTYVDGKQESQLVIQSVSFNVGVADSEFTVPTEVADAQ